MIARFFNNQNIILIFIILTASFLRLWQLGQVPASPDWDEASLGYNAYSIMQTGRDEYGKLFPLILRSFDDYKPALYVYFIIPFIKVFGLDVFAVRLPSAIFGVLTVIATYFLVRELMRMTKVQINAKRIGLMASFLLAVSPWHIQFSRIAFESNVGLSFNIFAVLFFLKGLKKPLFLLLSILIAGLNIYVYQSEKVFTPLLFTFLILIFRKELLSLQKKYLFSALFLSLLIIFSFLLIMISDKAILTRAKGVSVFADQTSLLKQNALRLQNDRENKDYLGLILDNRRFQYAKIVISGYISHFDLNWLFIKGDLSRHRAPGMGLLYLWELPFLLAGIYFLIFGSFAKKVKLIILGWFLIAPIPASITSGVPHAVRTLNFLPTFQIFTAIGIITFLIKISNIKYLPAGRQGQISKIRIKYLIYTLSFLFLIFNFLYYLNQYFVQYNYFNSQDWQYGYKEAVSEVKGIENKYDKIVVTNRPYLDQSYMFFLFYLKYPPLLYQNESKLASGGFRENHKFGKYEFRPIEDFNSEKKDLKTLFIGMPNDFPENAGIIKEINFLNGDKAIKIVQG